ncbi:S26 family signal peptidase [Allomesorhizobium camelthorni]|uniref:S26 family signal peptidase n=1 Tax=Allomesorhizobium camelthorni TaxID=475069 RepID=UPI00197F2C61|nr:S26 family signal peptidase [Mesorhizobium camelthorni]
MRSALVLTGVGLAILGASMIGDPTPRLVWNGSQSAPLGLYRVDPDAAISRGDLVLARAPRHIRQLAAERGYLPANVPLVKRVAALDGDTVCAVADKVVVHCTKHDARLGVLPVRESGLGNNDGA